ncbi:MAG: [protein-PII] uridylyltransferase family protein [Anaerolineae bacterium]
MKDLPDASQERLIKHLASTIPADLLRHGWLTQLELYLEQTANPKRALLNLDTLTQEMSDKYHFWHSLASNLHQLQILLTLFAGSQHLSQILIRQPGYWARLMSIPNLAQTQSVAQYEDSAQTILDTVAGDESQASALCRWQGWQMLRIGICDLTGMLDLTSVTSQLSNLADSLVRTCLRLSAGNASLPLEGFTILALGKLGGQELNYSSDIDLVFLAVFDAASYQHIAERTIKTLSQVTGEGFLYRVDMRLRPWGQMGALVPTRSGYVKYMQENARLWEKQALLKARPIAGNISLGAAFLAEIGPLLAAYDREAIRTDVRRMKQRIEDDLQQHGHSWGEVKLGRGAIRDIEFVTQYLQLTHCGQYPAILGANTLNVLSRLRVNGLITAREYRVLSEGYTFLRPLEHYLQMMDYRQIHTLPREHHELDALARRLGFAGDDAGGQLLTRFQQHTEAIRSIYEQQLYGKEVLMSDHTGDLEPQVRLHLARLNPSYEDTFTPSEILHHTELLSQLNPTNYVEVEAARVSDRETRLTIVGYDFAGELSLICGLLLANGFSIIDGNIFTYEPEDKADRTITGNGRRMIVDELNIESVHPTTSPDVWQRYHDDLEAFLHQIEIGHALEVRGELAKRVAVTLTEASDSAPNLQPIELQIDNTSSERYTVLHIEAADTLGFLYELTNALALVGFHISLVTVDSTGQRAHDTLYLTDAVGLKITSEAKKRELTTATILVKHFTHLLPRSPNPESALLHFRELLGELLRRPDWPQELASLERPEVLAALARLLGVSDFLWDDFLRLQFDSLFPLLRDIDELRIVKSRSELSRELQELVKLQVDFVAKKDALNRFKDREMFRIDLRHIQGVITDFSHFSNELSDLADAVLGTAIELCINEVALQYGLPCAANGMPIPWSLNTLGKCGGRELGYASDIELLFVYASTTLLPTIGKLSVSEFFNKVVQELLQMIHSKQEGIFTIDLQLRPYGSSGSMAVSLESFKRYYAPEGSAWPYERQALIKLRPIAGDPALAKQLEDLRDKYVYNPEAVDVNAVRAMRERQVRNLVAGGRINVKFSPGGTVDAEYLVQLLQMRYGLELPDLRLTSTLEAMDSLAKHKILSLDQHQRLQTAYVFLRRMVDALRMVRGNTKDLTIPDEGSDEYAYLARRMGYGINANQLLVQLLEYMSTILSLQTQLWDAMSLRG